MNQPRKPKKVKAPEGCESYLTAGKEYDVVRSDVNMIEINSDTGTILFSKIKGSNHLDDQDWIVTEWEDEANN